MFKVVKGEVESKLFDTDKLPAGWSDSPPAAKAKAAAPKIKKVETPAVIETGVSDGNSTGHNQLFSEAGGNTGSESNARE